jgi:hypothetical protein
MTARGTFDVKLAPQPPVEGVGDPSVGRMTLEKRFSGDLEGTSRGEMLAVGTQVKGSAGYVAMERVHGTLEGRTGTFALQHNGTMARGVPALTIGVVPDSGTGALAGIRGTMVITIVEKRHDYEFIYAFEEDSPVQA